MATLNQLLKLQQQIEAAEQKQQQRRDKRTQLIIELGLKRGDYFKGSGENFVTIDDIQYRLWVSVDGRIKLEALKF